MEEKIKIIKEIVKHHPGYGIQRGYSWYVGGMRDTGDWKWDVLVDQPLEDLQSFLEELIRADHKVKEAFEEEQRIADLPEEEKTKIYKERAQRERDAWRKLFETQERFLLWGK